MSKHTEGEEIDKFAVALGLVPGVPVTPSEIGRLLFGATSESTSSGKLPSTLESLADEENWTTNSIGLTKSSRVNLRPSDEIIASFILPSKSVTRKNEDFSPTDDLMLIKLHEDLKVGWSRMAIVYFPERKWGSLQVRYQRKLQKVESPGQTQRQTTASLYVSGPKEATGTENTLEDEQVFPKLLDQCPNSNAKGVNECVASQISLLVPQDSEL